MAAVFEGTLGESDCTVNGRITLGAGAGEYVVIPLGATNAALQYFLSDNASNEYYDAINGGHGPAGDVSFLLPQLPFPTGLTCRGRLYIGKALAAGAHADSFPYAAAQASRWSGLADASGAFPPGTVSYSINGTATGLTTAVAVAGATALPSAGPTYRYQFLCVVWAARREGVAAPTLTGIGGNPDGGWIPFAEDDCAFDNGAGDGYGTHVWAFLGQIVAAPPPTAAPSFSGTLSAANTWGAAIYEIIREEIVVGPCTLTVCARNACDQTPLVGATVYIDDVARGVTGGDGCLTVPGLGSGSHTVRVEDPGYGPEVVDWTCTPE